MLLLIFWVATAVLGTHICSLLESTLLSVRIPALLVQKNAGSRGAARLLFIKQHRVNDAIGAILILNTLMSILGSTFAGAQAAAIYGSRSVIYVSIGLTVILLFCSELIPKTLAVRYPLTLSAAAGYVLATAIVILRPFLFVTNAVVYLIARRPGDRITRRELDQAIRHAGSEGALTAAESELIGAVMKSNSLRVTEVMTPIEEVFSMGASQTLAALVGSTPADAFSRIPIYQGNRSNILGYRSHREALKAAAKGADKSTDLSAFMHPIPKVEATDQVEDVLQFILNQHEALAIVQRSTGDAAGLVTLEDLFEAMLGMDITDEAEAIVQLRPAVSAHRRARLYKLRKRQIEDQTTSD